MIAAALQEPLTQLWSAAYAAGSKAAGGTVNETSLSGLLGQMATRWIRQVVATTIRLLAKALAAGQSLRDALLDKGRLDGIAQTEVTRGMSAGARAAYEARNVLMVRWVTEDGCCDICEANEAQGAHPLGVPFQSGSTEPPEHMHCRCAIVPAEETDG